MNIFGIEIQFVLSDMSNSEYLRRTFATSNTHFSPKIILLVCGAYILQYLFF